MGPCFVWLLLKVILLNIKFVSFVTSVSFHVMKFRGTKAMEVGCCGGLDCLIIFGNCCVLKRWLNSYMLVYMVVVSDLNQRINIVV